MLAQGRRAPREQQRHAVRTRHQRNEHRGGTGERQRRAVGIHAGDGMVAVRGVLRSEARFRIEPLPGALLDGGRLEDVRRMMVGAHARDSISAAGAMGKKAPAEATPSMATPSIVRVSARSTSSR